MHRSKVSARSDVTGRSAPADCAAVASASVQEETGDKRLAVLLAMAMFVFVIDTSLMNVSISAVVRDLDTTVSGVQSAIAIEALVSAAFILIGSKIGDLFGRKRAYITGLVLYISGALTMTVTQSLTPIIIFWAVVGGLGASLYMPAMQSLVHGNFSGRAQAQAYALIGAAAAIAAAIGPLLGGFLTTYLSWRVGFMVEAAIIVVVLIGSRRLKDVPFTGDRGVDIVGSLLSVLGMGGLVIGILVWQEGGEYVGALLAVGLIAMFALARWLIRRKAEGRPALLDPGLFRQKLFSFGISQGVLQQVALGGLLITLPIYFQLVLEYNAMGAGLSLAPLSLTMFAAALIAGKRAGRRRPAALIRAGFALLTVALAALIALVPSSDSGWDMALPLVLAGTGFGLLVSQLNNYTLASIDEDRVGEAAGVNSATGSFGLSLGLAVAGAVMLATLSIAFTSMSNASTVLEPSEKQQVATVLEDDAQVMSDTQLQKLLVDHPEDIQQEIVRINTEARPLSLQVALAIPLLAALIGLISGFRMMRLPDPASTETPVALG
jgi:MFS family permease